MIVWFAYLSFFKLHFLLYYVVWENLTIWVYLWGG